MQTKIVQKGLGAFHYCYNIRYLFPCYSRITRSSS